MKKHIRSIILVVALVMVVCVASIGGTFAWLTAKTDTVTNTFTVGNISIQLTETPNNGADWTAKLVPGHEYAKDPVVSVDDGSEDCWLFVKFEQNVDTYVDYTSNLEGNGWTALAGVNGVYYRTVLASDTTREFHLLDGDKVTVKDTITQDTMPAAGTDLYMKYTAYAVQQDGVADAAAAWDKVKDI